MNTQDIIYRFESDVIDNHHIGKNDDSVITILSSKSNILLSVPHSVKQLRDNKIKVADINTYGIARLVQGICNCNLIASLGSRNSDPNYDKSCYYKSQLEYLINHTNIGIVLDIHGCTDKSDYIDIDLGTNFGKTLCNNDILNLFHSNDLIISNNKYFKSENINTVTSFISNLFNIPSIQMEISYTCRCTNKSDLLVDYLVNLVNKLQVFINEGEVFNGEKT